MRFTYLPDEETIIMSTSVRTKKYNMLERTGRGGPLIGSMVKIRKQQQQQQPHRAKQSKTKEEEEESIALH
jgi:hypothetical protein